jgi:hypothetical protein
MTMTTSPESSVDDVASRSECSLDKQIIMARQQLLDLKATGKRRLCEHLAQETEMKRKYQDANARLKLNLEKLQQYHTRNSNTHNIYMTRLKEVYDPADLPPIYVLKTQVQLCHAMHHTFQIHPHQMTITKNSCKELTIFLHEEGSNALRERQRVEDSKGQLLLDVSQMAASNKAARDEYEKVIEEQMEELRPLRAHFSNDDSTVYFNSVSEEESHKRSSFHSSFKSLADSATSFRSLAGDSATSFKSLAGDSATSFKSFSDSLSNFSFDNSINSTKEKVISFAITVKKVAGKK